MSTLAATPTDSLFDLDAGRLCLDFANTFDSAGEHLNSYADLVGFVLQSALLTPEDAAWLRASAEQDQVAAEGVLVRGRALRSAISAIFSAVARGEAVPERSVAQLNTNLAASMSHARVVPTARGGYEWGWSGRNMDAPLWPIVRSAADLLTSEAERKLVRLCNANDCNWLFVDTSKNRTRQWCSMQACGNREKARRHYQRLRARRDPALQADAGQST